MEEQIQEQPAVPDGFEIVNEELWEYSKEGTPNHFQGIYLNSEERGKEGSIMHFFQTPKGIVAVWGCQILDTRLKTAKPGQEVYLHYKGMFTPEKGRSYHKFDVYKKPMNEP